MIAGWSLNRSICAVRFANVPASLPFCSKPINWKFTRKPAAAAPSRKEVMLSHHAASGEAVLA